MLLYSLPQNSKEKAWFCIFIAVIIDIPFVTFTYSLIFTCSGIMTDMNNSCGKSGNFMSSLSAVKGEGK